MASVSSRPTAPHELKGPIDLALFPDGLKTTGQHEPLPEFVRSFDSYPKEITGPTAWEAEDFKGKPEQWTHRFTPAEIDELSATADAFIAAGTPLTGISKVLFFFFLSFFFIVFEANRADSEQEQLPSPEPRPVSTSAARGSAPWPRVYSVQGPACDCMGQCQIRSSIYGPRNVSGLLCEPEQPRACVGPCQGFRRGLEAD